MPKLSGLPTEIPQFLKENEGLKFSAQALSRHSRFQGYRLTSIEKALRSLAAAAKIRDENVSKTRRKKAWIYWWEPKCLPQVHRARKNLK